MKIRVIDLYFDPDSHHPLLDDQRQQKQNHGPYLYFGKAYAPGQVLDLPDDVARTELQISGIRRREDGHLLLGTLEPFERYEQRQEVLRKREAQLQIDPDLFARKSQELEAQVQQNQRLRQLVDEKEGALRSKERDIERAKAEVPENTLNEQRALMERLAKIEAALGNKDAEADDLRKKLAAQEAELAAMRRVPPAPPPLPGRGRRAIE